ncbi:MAG: tetratricopeptide repeat protein [Pseudomonadota bacterium]|nr:tetratricopeptide repeat protein [Pseudomonadota bacterium]
MQAEYEAEIIVKNIKDFYQKYKNLIFTSVISFFVICVITMSYQWYHYRYESRASADFFVIMNNDQDEQKISQVKQFVNDYPSSPYAFLAKLILISDDLQNGNWQGVDMQTKEIISANAPDFIIDQAYFLQARRFLATKQPQKSLDALNKIKSNNQVGIYIIRGLAEKELGHYKKADETLLKANKLLYNINPESSLKNFIWYQQSSVPYHE